MLKKALVCLILAISITTCLFVTRSHAMGNTESININPDIAKWKEGIGKATDQLDIMMSVLDELLNQKNLDLKALFKNFASRLSTIEKLPKEAKSIAQSIEAKKKAYLSDWQKKNKGITDPKVLEKAESVRDGVISGLSNLKDLAEGLQNSYAPFINDLKDIKKNLAENLDIQKLFSIATSIMKSKDNAAILKEKTDEFMKQLYNTQDALSTEL